MSKLTFSEIFKELSSAQLQALDKGIDFDLNITFNQDRVPYANVKLCYYSVSETSESYMFSTTLSEDYCDSKNRSRIKGVFSFIQSLTPYTE